jgi:dUTP pyrophosphatase
MKMIIEPFESKLIPTGLVSSFSSDYVAVFRERGSTGVKNIKINAGVIDSGFRGEWFVCLYNANSKPLIITKETNQSALDALKDDYIIYPYTKAIGQALTIPIAKLSVEEVSLDEIMSITSERGTGKIGSSNK